MDRYEQEADVSLRVANQCRRWMEALAAAEAAGQDERQQSLFEEPTP